MTQTHYLKTDRAPFAACMAGLKRFEFRRNDREYKSGDDLVLEELDLNGARTGRRLRFMVTFVLYGPDYGVPNGFCVMSLMGME